MKNKLCAVLILLLLFSSKSAAKSYSSYSDTSYELHPVVLVAMSSKVSSLSVSVSEKIAEIIEDARTVEEQNQTIVYSYDRNNQVLAQTNARTPLIVEAFPPSVIKRTEKGYYLEFQNAFFGTLELSFPKALESQESIHVILSEYAVNEAAWTRKNMNAELNGFGVSYYEMDVVIPKGISSYRLILPERPLPDVTTISGGWEGGLLPFAYCSIDGLNNLDLTKQNFRQLAVHVGFNDDASTFITDNEALDKVYSFCKDTIKATTYAGFYVDGFRELMPYEADALINELGHFSVDDNYEIAKNTLLYLADHHTWPTEWVLQTIPLAYEYYMYSGDIDTIRSIYPQLQNCIISEAENKDGLLDSSLYGDDLLSKLNLTQMRDIVDWPISERDGFDSKKIVRFDDVKRAVLNKYRSVIACEYGYPYASTLYNLTSDSQFRGTVTISSPNSVVNAFYYNSLLDLSFLANELGKQDDVTYYADKAETLKSAYQSKFVSPITGLVIDSTGSNHSSLQANVFALDFGLVPDENVERVVKYIKSKGMACSVYGAQYLLESLIKNGEAEYAISLMASEDTSSWNNMMNTGSKLTTEAWDEYYKIDMDWNHAWSTAPVNIITRYLLGIRPSKPGCGVLEFEPKLTPFKSCKASVPVRGGRIQVEYEWQGENTYRILLDNSKPCVYCVPENIKLLIIDDIDYSKEEQSIFIDSGQHTIVYQLSN